MHPAGSNIRRVLVDSLFGDESYSYRIDTDSLADIARHIFIIHGENGCGKTTILQILFHILSTAPQRGHKTALSRVPFRRFEVEFASGTKIAAARENPNDTNFTLSLIRGDVVVASALYETRVDDVRHGPVISPDDATEEQSTLEQHLRSLNIDVRILNDDRTLDSDSDRPQRHGRVLELDDPTTLAAMMMRRVSGDGPITDIDVAFSRVHEYVRSRAFAGTAEGEKSVQAMYVDIIESMRANETRASPEGADDVTETIRKLAEQTSKYAEHGLMLPLKDADYFIDAIVKSRNTPSGEPIQKLILGYAESLAKRADALRALFQLLQRFETTVNGFLNRKYVKVGVSGVKIYTNKGKRLDPGDLSSGERHLMLLFCNVLIARDHAMVLLIDEPEISLNPVWQRNLPDALLALVQGTSTQLILATHSLEILSLYSDASVFLEPGEG
jgi:energy-coupling factor transporter ATP-binding protein EcfA2